MSCSLTKKRTILFLNNTRTILNSVFLHSHFIIITSLAFLSFNILFLFVENRVSLIHMCSCSAFRVLGVFIEHIEIKECGYCINKNDGMNWESKRVIVSTSVRVCYGKRQKRRRRTWGWWEGRSTRVMSIWAHEWGFAPHRCVLWKHYDAVSVCHAWICSLFSLKLEKNEKIGEKICLVYG